MTTHTTLSKAPRAFQALPRESTLAARVTSELETMIAEQHIQPGNRLPPERELAEQFGVSKTVIREAARALAAKGLLEVRHGSGMIVRSPSSETVAKSMAHYLRAGQREVDFFKVHQVRQVLEIAIAALAAKHRTGDDLNKLEANVVELESIVEGSNLHANRERYVVNDVEFHAALARATGNELFSLLLDSIVDIMISVRRATFDVPDSHGHATKYHRAILEQVKRGDEDGARRVMREHLEDSAKLMRKAFAMRGKDSDSQGKS